MNLYLQNFLFINQMSDNLPLCGIKSKVMALQMLTNFSGNYMTT